VSPRKIRALVLFHHLLDQRHHRVELLAQALEHRLLQDVPRALRSSDDLFGELLRLSHHSAGRIEQLAIGSIELLLALLGSGARRPGDVQNPHLYAATAVAQLGAGDLANPFHGADQNSHAIAQQARIGRIVDLVSTTVVSTRIRRPAANRWPEPASPAFGESA
jgi:hypothetical protein